MAPASGYRFLLDAEPFYFFQTLRPAERQALNEAFQFLADHPFLEGDYQENSGDGRNVETLLKGRFPFTFWTDHPAKEVRILRVERV